MKWATFIIVFILSVAVVAIGSCHFLISQNDPMQQLDQFKVDRSANNATIPERKVSSFQRVATQSTLHKVIVIVLASYSLVSFALIILVITIPASRLELIVSTDEEPV
ncbi:Hypothetical predicted protein [Cloeon dipterum]|uniref:Transmembrane protein n=1 Tax=Cloeon dipterum TaxID=197152 RepID=A0A8S1E0B7_9INSE|nr:Hypothetical predicted protein [Cloeon dipterum]